MRQTLLRIRLDELWLTNSEEGITQIGVGFLLIPWAILGLFWCLRLSKSQERREEALATGMIWVVGLAVILSAPTWAPLKAIPVYGYGFMLFLGFLTGGWLAARRAERQGIPGELIWDLAMWVFFGGIGGARLFYLIQYHERVFAKTPDLASKLKAIVNLPDGGLVLYGGVILGIVGYVVFCRLRKLNALLLADICVPSVFVGLAFGRMGCFLNGCCYGDRCTLPWAVTFPKGSVPFQALVNRGFLSPDAVASLPLHPTQLYSVLNALILAYLTSVYFKYRQRNGSVVVLALLTYPVTRMVIEILRGDEMGQFGTGLTISQIVSLCVFATGLVFAFWLAKSPAKTLTTGTRTLSS